MRAASRCFGAALLFLWIWLRLFGLASIEAAVATPSWTAAYVQSGPERPAVALFPESGPKSAVLLPETLGRNMAIAAFSADGKAIYVQSHPAEGITKIEFNPLRLSTVPGSTGLASIWSLTVVNPSGQIVVSGLSAGKCGTFELDSRGGPQRALLAGAYPLCGGGGGVVSPDGRRAVRHVLRDLFVTELGSGTSRIIGGFEDKTPADDVSWLHRVAWSPDGRWISVINNEGRIVIVDSDNTARRRNLGPSSGGAPISWSPDSKYLLVPKSGLRCSLSLYFDALEIVDIETGRRTGIRSSRCEIGSGWIGWIDPRAQAQ